MTNYTVSLAALWVTDTYSLLAQHQNPTNARDMSAYMKDRFAFLGIPKPVCAELQRRTWAGRPRGVAAIEAIHALWAIPVREAQYVACDLVKSESKHWPPEEGLSALEAWVTAQSWWDSVDTLAVHGVGALLRRHPDTVWPTVQRWIYSENMWLNRTAMIGQLGFRAETRTSWLEEALSAHIHSNEFFHRKAIGWALRDYAKTNPRWVKQWVDAHPELSGLSRREALRLLGSREEA